MIVPHLIADTPIRLIWDVREKFLEGKNVLAFMKTYTRDPEKKESYSVREGIDSKHHMNSGFDSWFQDLLGLPAKTKGVYGTNGQFECAFMGYHVTNGEVSFSTGKDQPSHDLPRCDMSLTVDQIETESADIVLSKMKDYVDGTDLYLYKTTNSFHVYIPRLFTLPEIEKWLNFLVATDELHEGIIDRKWIQHNSCEQPVRINKTPDREYPYLYCVI